MTHTSQLLVHFLGAVCVALPLMASAGDAANGEALSTAKGCIGCHGVDGNSAIPTNPILAGQYEDYLEQALKQYRSGDRQNAIMSGFAAGLTDKEIADLAAWFSSNESNLTHLDK